MSNDDKRRRQDGSTAKLSVADLLARREAETQPIPRITERTIDDRPSEDRRSDDEETVRFSAASLSGAATNLSGRELHITELLRREGRAGEEERGGGFSVPKLVAMASGGVVLAGTVAFTATNLMSSPDERPLAEVRFDARPAARATNTLTKDLGAAAKQQQEAQAQAETTTTTPEQAPEQTTTNQRTPRPNTQQQQQPTTTTTTQAPSTQAPSSSNPQTTTPAPTTTTTTPSPSDETAPPPSSSATPPSSDSSTPPSEDTGSGIEVGLDLGAILNPLGGFDFFAPAN